MANVTVTDALITDAAFWAALDMNSGSSINATAVSSIYQITITAGSITFTDTTTSTVVASYGDGDLAGGSFSNVQQFQSNDGGSDVSGSVGLGSNGYTGGDGDDIFIDDGSTGGRIVAGAGNDTIQGGSGDNYNMRGQAGDDLLISGGGNNQLRGDAGDDTLIGESGGGNLLGNGGNDTIIREDGNYNVVGGGGDDTIIIDGGTGNVDAGGGSDTVVLNAATTSFINGGGGTNSLVLPVGASFAPYSPGNSGGVITFADGSTTNYGSFDADDISIACFASGTLIDTPVGMVRIDDLSVGDLVNTLDDGPQEVQWIGRREISAEGAFAPICFGKGSMGNMIDLFVSPQHRILVSNALCDLYFGAPEVFCAAKHLCDSKRIYRKERPFITYFHLMFAKHQIVAANGVWAESFFVGDYQAGADVATYNELISLFPELAQRDHPARHLARPSIKGFEARALRESLTNPTYA